MEMLGIPAGLFPDIVDPGTDLGPVLPDLASRLGLAGQPHVSTVASHDTASAVVAVPMAPECAAYISCGTWGLVGVELSRPVLTEAARSANFTNEVGADGRIRFLRNVMGLWLLSESIRYWERGGTRIDLVELLDQAAACPPPSEVFDTDDATFLTPGDMPSRIASWYRTRGLTAPTTVAETAQGHCREPRRRIRRQCRGCVAALGHPGEDGARRRRGRPEPGCCVNSSQIGSGSRSSQAPSKPPLSAMC